jgi:hypothetical protein
MFIRPVKQWIELDDKYERKDYPLKGTIIEQGENAAFFFWIWVALPFLGDSRIRLAHCFQRCVFPVLFALSFCTNALWTSIVAGGWYPPQILADPNPFKKCDQKGQFG